MKLKALGRYLLVRTDYDLVDELEKRSTIALPDSYKDRMKGGIQVHTVLSIGESAFDDEPVSTRESVCIGTQIVTARYPGHEIDFDPLAKDEDVVSYRLISSDEVHAIVDEGGVDVRSAA